MCSRRVCSRRNETTRRRSWSNPTPISSPPKISPPPASSGSPSSPALASAAATATSTALAPVLGFFHSRSSDSGPPFVPTAKSLHVQVQGCHKDYAVWDCRHGHVLLSKDEDTSPLLLLVWDPMTSRRRELDGPRIYDAHGAVVLCAVPGCDHRALCHDGPFRVVFVGLDYTDDGCDAYACVSLPEVGDEWSDTCSPLDLAMDAYFLDMPPVSIQDAVYFLLTYGYDDAENADDIFILKYDLGSHCLSLIDAPPVEIDPAGDTTLMAMEDGGLGFAHSDGFTFYLWSRRMGSDGVPAWTQRRVMDLRSLLPGQDLKKRVRLIGSVEGRDIIFISIDLGIYEISLKSLQLKNIGKIEEFYALIPYMSFYNQPERATLCDAAH